MLKKIIFLLFIIAIGLGGFFYWNFTHAECIPVSGDWLNREDYTRIEKIIAAMSNLKKTAAEDYQKLCRLTTQIKILDFENPDLSVPEHALGAYHPNDKNLSLPGYIMINRTTTGFFSTLEMVLIHETCHGEQAAEGRGFDEAECHQRGHKYLLALPPLPLEQKSDELIKYSGYERSVYCRTIETSGKNSTPYKLSGACVFINNLDMPAKSCAEVYLTYAGEKIKQKQVCAELSAVDYEEVKFELSDAVKRQPPQDTDPLKQYLPDWPYEFGFDSPDKL